MLSDVIVRINLVVLLVLCSSLFYRVKPISYSRKKLGGLSAVQVV